MNQANIAKAVARAMQYRFDPEDLEKAIAVELREAVAQERERCTKSCLATIKGGPTTGEDFRAITAIQNCAAAIRRGE